MKCHWTFLKECRKSDLASAGCSCPGAEHSPYCFRTLGSTHVLYTCGTNLIIYIFTTARWKKKWICIVEVWSNHGADFLEQNLELEGTCKCLNTKWLRDCFSWTETSVKWHDIWKQLLQDCLISALKTSDSPSTLNAKTSTSFVNIKQNNGLHTNVWAGFQTAWERILLCVFPQKNPLFYLCKGKLSRVVVNSVTQGQ